MKKYAILAIAAIGMLAACSKNEVAPQQPSSDDSQRQAVMFSVGSPVAVASKSTGTVGGLQGNNNWAGQTLYVFGYESDVTDFSTGEAGAFIWHVQTTAPATGEKDVISVMNADPLGDGSVGQTPEPYYYANGDVLYDFYGYHIDDAYDGGAAPAPVAEADRVYVPFHINGGQDLMVAKADPAIDVVGTDLEATPEYAYSAYAARKGVQPTLQFRHELARFTFKIQAGAEGAEDFQVSAIRLQSKTHGNLVVVAQPGADSDNLGVQDVTGDPEWLSLQQKGASGSLEQLAPKAPLAFGEDPTEIGESILVLPGEATYDLEVEVIPTDPTITTPIDALKKTLNIADVTGGDPDATAFEAGKSYEVTIKVLGINEVEISAALTPWEDGGKTEVDFDEQPTPRN